MPKIYLSASQQNHNMYADGVFTEQEVMNKLVKLTAVLLEKLGYEVKSSIMGNTMVGNIEEGNAYKPDIYIALHSNACTGKNDGTLALYISDEGKRLAQCLYNHVAKVTPSTDEGLREGKGLWELTKTHAPAVILESYYHDNKADMKWGLLNLDLLAEAIAKGVVDYFNHK